MANPTKTSAIGIDKIVHREGNFLHEYRDTQGVPTIGVGHTSAAGPPHVTIGMQITEAESESILAADLAPIEKQFAEYVKVPVVLQNEYDAIISVVLNVGPKFWHGTAIREWNAGNKTSAAHAILLWNMPPEIRGRRQTEYKQFLTPYPGSV